MSLPAFELDETCLCGHAFEDHIHRHPHRCAEVHASGKHACTCPGFVPRNPIPRHRAPTETDAVLQAALQPHIREQELRRYLPPPIAVEDVLGGFDLN